ncbi:MAG: methyltransferase domain-containing protein [Candidatus Tectomicrobia bacterium]|uniref:Methyltransferase domain-containing protein n=1 Tax=Tectimicrobiota bacterium TaxID=2528274 RepID=A0A938B414_UNCTE|nr:methyltransferase domain-containing protein [Candidatus Tectomicrobia bacterium]
MIRVEHDWWKTLFDEVYLVTDAPFVCNPALTKREVDMIETILHLSPSARILDICGGQGRHALELARRGYQSITVLDYSNFLLDRGRWEAAAAGLHVTFCQGDARAITLPTASWDAVLLMANSFGYFVDAADDKRVLTEVVRLLTAQGRFLLDLVDRDVALRQFCPESWHEATDDIVVCWKRELSHDVVHIRELVISKTTGLLRDRTYAERLYSPEAIRALLTEVGFHHIEIQPGAFVYDPAQGTDYGLATNRMLVTAVKG